MTTIEPMGLTPNEPTWPTMTSVSLALLLAAAFPVQGQGKEYDARSHRAAHLPSLNGAGNNVRHPDQGSANTHYLRLGKTNYADGIGQPVEGPNARYLSNRVFADGAQNLFSENGVTQWAWTWGQFVDHTIALRKSGEEPLLTAFDANDPLETFAHNDGVLRATRSLSAPGTGVPGTGVKREQININSSYLDAFAVYGGDEARLEWLREGPLDGDLSNNGAKLMLTHTGYLPRAVERGDAANAPVMERQGQLLGAADADEQQIVAGDVRANENIALTAVQTLFAREHNRIVDRLPADWSEQRRFDAARLLIIALQQRITYEEFLPAVGVDLEPAHGYRPHVDASISNEFATVGFRAHSMIHGEIEMAVPATRYNANDIERLRTSGLELEHMGDDLEIAVPLNLAFGNPQLLTELGLGPVLQGLAGEAQYRNDEQIDDQLRSVMFQLPDARVEDPAACLDGPMLNECYALVGDVGVLDIVRGRDHGMPSYTELRTLYNLPPINSFTALTGEMSEAFPQNDPLVDIADPINDPDIMDFIYLADANGESLVPGSEEADGEGVTGVRRSTLAARLNAIYGDTERLDAFIGMVSEAHLPGSEFGELQQAMWKRQFEALRDGDRFHYQWSRPLRQLERDLLREMRPMHARKTKHGDAGSASSRLGDLDWRRTLAQVIADNTALSADDLQDNVFYIAR